MDLHSQPRASAASGLVGPATPGAPLVQQQPVPAPDRDDMHLAVMRVKDGMHHVEGSINLARDLSVTDELEGVLLEIQEHMNGLGALLNRFPELQHLVFSMRIFIAHFAMQPPFEYQYPQQQTTEVPLGSPSSSLPSIAPSYIYPANATANGFGAIPQPIHDTITDIATEVGLTGLTIVNTWMLLNRRKTALVGFRNAVHNPPLSETMLSHLDDIIHRLQMSLDALQHGSVALPAISHDLYQFAAHA
ncbi:hypothetical protein DENSPDRAFT_855148 [Dentipellis sp. KUC8613]|nr:hypothetical protein DENSPDRAFT_855148 [Dentipellis sp. KUC8613]